MRLLLVRHAQSANNALHFSQRIPDPPLTSCGQLQAECLASWLSNLPLTHLWCSPFLRSIETTEAVRRRVRLRPEIHRDLHEQGGCYSGHEQVGRKGEPGMSRSELGELFPDYQLDPLIQENGWWESRPFETDELARQRAEKIKAWFEQQITASDMLAAAIIHADFKRQLLRAMLSEEIDVKAFGPILNASVTSLRRTDSGWKVDYFNSISHVPFHWITD